MVLLELLGFLLEIVGDLLLEALLDAGLARLRTARRRENWDPVAATLGYAALGGTLGLLFALVVPGRILGQPVVPGLSMVVAPAVVGVGMHWWGVYRRAEGRPTTNLATWYGGAALALGIAVARYALVAR